MFASSRMYLLPPAASFGRNLPTSSFQAFATERCASNGGGHERLHSQGHHRRQAPEPQLSQPAAVIAMIRPVPDTTKGQQVLTCLSREFTERAQAPISPSPHSLTVRARRSARSRRADISAPMPCAPDQSGHWSIPIPGQRTSVINQKHRHGAAMSRLRKAWGPFEANWLT